MVKGLDIFQAWFAEHADQYVLIGGTAASLTMEEAGLPFRATKDLDPKALRLGNAAVAEVVARIAHAYELDLPGQARG